MDITGRCDSMNDVSNCPQSAREAVYALICHIEIHESDNLRSVRYKS